MDEPNRNREGQGIRINIGLWHLIILLVAQIATTGIAAGALNEKVDQLDRTVQEMRSERYIPRSDYNDRVQELEHQIERLEGKIDALTRLVK